MISSDIFKTWLIDVYKKNDGKPLASSSADKYIGAIGTISQHIDKNLYESSVEELRNIISSDTSFIEKNDRGNNMYSSAVERLIECKIYIENNMPTAVLDYQQRHEKEVASYQQHLFISPPMGNPKPEKINAPDSHYIKRDPKVSAYVKQRADGTCECCHHAAPFQKLDGELFLEIHHMKPLAQGGSDTVANAIAICPNCHRELHHGAKRDSLIEKIYLEHTSIERE